jgi:hypothetical protein
MTRAMLALARGDWPTAVAYHPLAPLLLAEAVLAWLIWGLCELGFTVAPSRRTVNAWLAGNAALLLGVWLWRFLHHTLPVR